ncbi:MAG: methylmalonyl-CoA mutase family protein, partial [Acidobacteriota bacterium]|nr:methylmalonyl-CoA mutase family protein [Acidobacteriota bacterium]
IDSLGGSYYLETLTAELETSARGYFEEIDRRGGMVASIEAGYPQREVANSAYREQQAFDRGESPLVGVNQHVDGAPLSVPTLLIDDQVAAQQLERIEGVRKSRNETSVFRALEALGRAAKGTGNLMPLIIEAARTEATLGEMCDTLRSVWGEYEESPAL